MRLAGIGIATSLALTGCAGSAPSGDTSGADLTVAVGFYPLAWAAKQVGGDHVTVTELTSPGMDPHDMELTARQVGQVQSSDVVVHLEGFQPAVDDAIKQTSPKRVVEVGAVANLADHSADDHDHEGHDHSDHDHEGHDHSDHDHEGHDHSDHDHEGHTHDVDGKDPHFWLDPQRMKAVTQLLAEQFAEADPDHAEDYRQAARTTAEELDKLDQEFTSGLSSCQRREIITSHTAFSYLADRYELEQVGITGIAPGSEASPARIAEIQKIAKERNATTIFVEPLANKAVATSIARDLGLRTAVLDPLEGVTDESPGQDYPSIMRANLAEIRTANECS